MNITIKIDDNIYVLHNEMTQQDVTNFITEYEKYTRDSKFNPKKWLVNNILYSITCPETKKNMLNCFNTLEHKLVAEY